MLEKVIRGIKRRLEEARRGSQLICSDLLQNWLAAGVACPIKLRPILYRLAGNKIGKNCYLSPRIFLGPGQGKLSVGGTFINYNCWFDLGDDIEIGENCNIAMNVHFINGTHEIGDENRRAAQGITKRIVVGAGSWIGADTIIMPGVTIGKGVVVGTGSLVTTNLEDNAIYFGRPARLYKKL